jgi:hypothetical protein
MKIAKIAVALAAACVVLLMARAASAQAPATAAVPSPPDDRLTRQIVPFLERSYLFKSTESDLLFEAAVFPHLVLWQNFDDLVDARVRRQPADGRQYWALSVTPGVHLRMLTAFSEPVRTPSYLPRIDVQRLWSTNYREAIDALDRRSGASVDIWAWHAAVRHHSNGQDGCLFRGQVFTTCGSVSTSAARA